MRTQSCTHTRTPICKTECAEMERQISKTCLYISRYLHAHTITQTIQPHTQAKQISRKWNDKYHSAWLRERELVMPHICSPPSHRLPIFRRCVYERGRERERERETDKEREREGGREKKIDKEGERVMPHIIIMPHIISQSLLADLLQVCVREREGESERQRQRQSASCHTSCLLSLLADLAQVCVFVFICVCV